MIVIEDLIPPCGRALNTNLNNQSFVRALSCSVLSAMEPLCRMRVC